jgi:O-antigen ligase
LGMSAQDPANLGVSVVQTATARVLRAYGGFPHPNILGGWMAVGLVTSAWLTLTLNPSPTNAGEGDMKSPFRLSRLTRWEKGVWGIEGLFTLALFYSFSRSAWIAAGLGLAVLVLFSVRDRRRWLPPIGVIVTLSLVLTGLHWNLVSTRTNVADLARLEQRSVDARKQSLIDGVRIFQSRPFFGTGPNAELPVLAQLDGKTVATAPLEPPHLAWLLMLDNLGIVGVLITTGLALLFLRRALDRWARVQVGPRALAVSIVTVVFVLSLFDHYIWSLWSGQVLAATSAFIIIRVFEYRHKEKSA